MSQGGNLYQNNPWLIRFQTGEGDFSQILAKIPNPQTDLNLILKIRTTAVCFALMAKRLSNYKQYN